MKKPKIQVLAFLLSLSFSFVFNNAIIPALANENYVSNEVVAEQSEDEEIEEDNVEDEYEGNDLHQDIEEKSGDNDDVFEDNSLSNDDESVNRTGDIGDVTSESADSGEDCFESPGKSESNDDSESSPTDENRVLSKIKPKSMSEITKAVPFGKSKTTTLVKALVDKHYVSVVGNGRGTKYHL